MGRAGHRPCLDPGRHLRDGKRMYALTASGVIFGSSDGGTSFMLWHLLSCSSLHASERGDVLGASGFGQAVAVSTNFGIL